MAFPVCVHVSGSLPGLTPRFTKRPGYFFPPANERRVNQKLTDRGKFISGIARHNPVAQRLRSFLVASSFSKMVE